MNQPPNSAIEFRNVEYRVAPARTLLTGLNLVVRRGETLMLLGRSGSGKTTCLKLINRLLVPTAGDVFVEGKASQNWDPIQLRRSIGYATIRFGRTWLWCRSWRSGTSSELPAASRRFCNSSVCLLVTFETVIPISSLVGNGNVSDWRARWLPIRRSC